MKREPRRPAPGSRVVRRRAPRAGDFDGSLDFEATDFRARPDLYRVGRGEQGVLSVQPYKSELLPHWRFRTPADAEASAARIFSMYEDYRARGDFVGMDMARKFLQMGHTRARRYANHPGGRKYDPATGEELPRHVDPVKAESARIFKLRWDAVREDPEYQRLRIRHRDTFEGK